MTKLIPSTTPLRTFKGHEGNVRAVAVFPDRRRMVTGSDDNTLCLWDLETGVVLKKMEGHRSEVWALAVSRDGQIIASGDDSGEVIVWNGETGDSLTQPIEAHPRSVNSLDFSADGTVLATGSFHEMTVKLWCTKTWQQQAENQIAANSFVSRVRYSPSGELLAIATIGNIAIYNSGTREHVATLKTLNYSLAWTPDGTRLLSPKNDAIEEWDTSTWEKVGDPWKGHTKRINAIAVNPAGTLVASASEDNHVHLWRLSDRRNIAIFEHSSIPTCVTFSVDGNNILSGGEDNQISEWEARKGCRSNIFAIATSARYSSLSGELSTAQQLLTQEIDANADDYTSYANRSFVMARKQNWDHALEDAIKSISIQPSLTGYISKGIALCGKGNIRDARVAFDVASMFTKQDPDTIHVLLLIKAIALFNADQHEEAMLLITELAAARPNADTLACRTVEAYLRVQLGTKALDGARHNEAVDHFAAALNSSTFPSEIIHELCEDLVVLFGWDLESFWLTTHQKRCQAFLSAGKVKEALESHQHTMDTIDETEKASCLDWSNEFKEQCSALAARDGRILGAEIPGQDQDGYDVEPDFFRGIHGHSQISRLRPQQRPGRFKKLRLAVTRNPHPVPPPPPAPTPAPPTALPPAAAPTTFTAHVRHLFTWRPDHIAPPVVEVPFAQGRKRNAAAGAPPDDDSDIIRAEYVDDDPQDPNATQQLDTQQPDTQPNTQQPNTQRQRQPVAMQVVDTGEHGGDKSCFCC